MDSNLQSGRQSERVVTLVEDDRARIIEQAGVAMIVTDGDGFGVYANRAFSDLFGYSAHECEGLSLRAVLQAAASASADIAGLLGLTGTAEAAGVWEGQCIRKDGSTFQGRLRTSVVRDPGKGNSGLLVVQILDLADARRTEPAPQAHQRVCSPAFDNVGFGLWEWNPVNGEQWTSPQLKALLGYEEFGGRDEDWFAIIHPDDMAGVLSANERFLRQQTNDVYDYTFRARSSQDGWRWLHSRGRVTKRTADGAAWHVTGAMIDVTSLKHTEEQLLLANERLKVAIEVASLGIYDMRLPDGYMLASRETFRIFGREAEVQGGNPDVPDDWAVFQTGNDDPRGWSSWVHPGDIERIEKAWAQSLSDGKPTDVTYRIVRSDGEVRHTRSLAYLTRNAAGDVVRCVGVVRDITEERVAQEALATTSERLQIATEAGGVGVYDVDVATGAYYCNDRFYELYGVDAGSDIRRLATWRKDTWMTFVHPDDRERIKRRIRVAFAETSVFSENFRIVDGHQQVRHLRSLGRVIRHADGTPARGVGVTWDVTEERQAEEALAATTERLQLATEGVDIGVYDVDFITGAFNWTDRQYELYGLEPGSFDGQTDTWLGYLHAEDRERVRQEMTTLFEKPGTYHNDFRVFDKRQQRIRHLRSFGRVIHDADGRPVRGLGLTWDVTEERQAEQALVATTERLQLATEGVGIGVYDVDLITGAFDWTDRQYELYGLEPGSFDGQVDTWLGYIHPEDREHIRRRLAMQMETPGTYSDDFRVFDRRQQRVRHLRSFGRLIQDADGRTARGLGLTWDVTEERQAAHALATTNERLQIATEAGGIGIYDVDMDTKASVWSDRLSELYGLEPGSFDGEFETWIGYIHPDDRERIRRKMRAAIEKTSTFSENFRIIEQRHRSIRHVRSLGRVVRRPDGAPARGVGVTWDISVHTRLENALKEEKERLRITLDSIGDAVISTDTRACVTYLNPVAESMTGWLGADALERPVHEIATTTDDDGHALSDLVHQSLRSVRPIYQQNDTVLLSRSGARLDIQASAAPVGLPGGDAIGAVLVLKDTSQTRAMRRELEHQAYHDSLTGLPNRRAFERGLREAIDEADQRQRRHVLCFIDLDRFKVVNDSAGHAAGDALLREVGDLLRCRLTADDLAARLGGDEFAVLLRDRSVAEGERIAAQIADAIRAMRFRWFDRQYQIDAGIGLTVVTGNGYSTDELLSQADAACYSAKSSAGPSKVVVYEEQAQSAARRYRSQIRAASGLSDAIDRGRFCLYAQEVRDLSTDQPQRLFEILLRMRDDQGNIIPPEEFIPAAERFYLMDRLDRWVIHAVLHDYGARLCDAGMSVAINLSANSLEDPQLWDFLQAELAASPLPPNRLHLEITETALIENFTAAVTFIDRARAAGCRISLDDFGAGLSSFAYLRKFPVDTIKIDGSFIVQLTSNSVDRTIVESIHSIARRLGARTVAEQVEDLPTLELVREIGIDQAQGYAIAYPRPLAELL